MQLLQLWYHESCRVFQDRLVCAEDRDWFDGLLKDCIEQFDCSFDEVVPSKPVLFGDFMSLDDDNKVYTLIQDKERVSAASGASASQCNKYFKACFSVAKPLTSWFLTN